jgi:hypothetical protein
MPLAASGKSNTRWTEPLALLDRERLKRENLDVLIGESLAELSKRSGPVF